MDRLQELAIEELQHAKQRLLDIKKETKTPDELRNELINWYSTEANTSFAQAASYNVNISVNNISIPSYIASFDRVKDEEILKDVIERLASTVDEAKRRVESYQR